MNHRPFLNNRTKGAPVCGDMLVAGSYWQRLRGLLCRPQLAPGSGLLLVPSTGVHTIGMRHAIDVVFLSADRRVLRVCAAVPPWRVRLAVPGTQCVLELRQGEAARAGLDVNDQLELGSIAAAEGSPTQSEASPLPARPGWTVLLALLLVTQGVLCWYSFRASLQGRVDLRTYYAAGTAARLHGSSTLYNNAVEQVTQQALFHDGWRTLHFLYPPFAMLPYRSLAALPYRSAFIVVTLCNLLFLYAAAWLLVRHHARSQVSATRLALYGLCAFPCVIAMTEGQLSFVLLFLLTLFYCLERRGLHMLAGLCLALCLVKVQIALPVAALYLLWRRYRVVAGFAAGLCLLLLLSWSIAGVAGLRAYLAQLHSMGSVTLLDGPAAYLRYGVQTATEPNLHGIAVTVLGSGVASGALTLGLSLLLLLWAARRPASVGTAVCLAVLLSYHLLSYDLVLLLLPLALHCLRRWDVGGAKGAYSASLNFGTDRWLLGGCTVLLSAPVSVTLMMLHAMTAFALASGALLLVSLHGESHSAEPAFSASHSALAEVPHFA